MKLSANPPDDIELADAYAAAWQEWDDSDDAAVWEQAGGDGL